MESVEKILYFLQVFFQLSIFFFLRFVKQKGFYIMLNIENSLFTLLLESINLKRTHKNYNHKHYLSTKISNISFFNKDPVAKIHEETCGIFDFRATNL